VERDNEYAEILAKLKKANPGAPVHLLEKAAEQLMEPEWELTLIEQETREEE
jgi:hypothetical protein